MIYTATRIYCGVVRHIHSLPASQRPREKLLKSGVEALSLEEHLCVLFGSGTKQMPVMMIAKRVAKLLRKNTQPTLTQLRDLGIGQIKALQLLSSLSISTTLHAEQIYRPKNPTQIYALCQDIVAQDREYVLAFYFNARHELLKREMLAIGTHNAALLLPREIFACIKELPVTAIILANNHPSGVLEASEADQLFTERVHQAGEIVGVEILDHLIVTKTGWKQVM